MCSESIPSSPALYSRDIRATFARLDLYLLTKTEAAIISIMLRRKPTRVEDRADVAEEYELYLIEKERKKQQQQQGRGGAAEDFQMRDDDDAAAAATATPLRQQQRNMTRSRIGLGQ